MLGVMKAKGLSVLDFYNKVWREYADPASHPITARALSVQADIVDRRIRRANPRRVLDLGCGPAPVVRPESAPLVVHADLILEMLLSMRAGHPCPTVCLDARRLPFRDRCIDFVWCGLLIDHIEEPEGWIQELFRILAPGATLGLACWERSELPSDRYPGNTRMRYTTALGEELSVESLPTWETALKVVAQKDPDMEAESISIVPGAYVLQIAWARARA
jgi:SAM-dependent methyltransferase